MCTAAVDQSDGRSTDGESGGSVVECPPDTTQRRGITVPASRHTMKERYVGGTGGHVSHHSFHSLPPLPLSLLSLIAMHNC